MFNLPGLAKRPAYPVRSRSNLTTFSPLARHGDAVSPSSEIRFPHVKGTTRDFHAKSRERGLTLSIAFIATVRALLNPTSSQ